MLSPVTSIPPPLAFIYLQLLKWKTKQNKNKKSHSRLRTQERRNNSAQWCAIFCDCSNTYCSELYCSIFFIKENIGFLPSKHDSVLLNLVNIGMTSSVCMGRMGNCSLFPFKYILFFHYYCGIWGLFPCGLLISFHFLCNNEEERSVWTNQATSLP